MPTRFLTLAQRARFALPPQAMSEDDLAKAFTRDGSYFRMGLLKRTFNPYEGILFRSAPRPRSETINPEGNVYPKHPEREKSPERRWEAP